MSQETQIGNLGGGISDEDSKLVDSILNDINSSSGPQQGGQGQGQQPSPEQIKMMQQQMAQRQQQMAQQQAMAIRDQGWSGAAMLPYAELEYGGFRDTVTAALARFTVSDSRGG